MRISSQKFKIYNEIISSAFGFNAVSVAGDYSLSALISTIAYKSGDWTNGDIPIITGRASCFDDLQRIINNSAPFKLAIISKNNEWEFECSDEWKLLDGAPCPISSYLSQRKNFKTNVYANKERKSVIAITTGHVDETWIQAFESLFPKIFTWYYPALSDEDKTFFKSLSIESKGDVEDISSLFINELNKIADSLFDRNDVIETALKTYEEAGKKRRIENVNSKIFDIKSEIDRLIKEIHNQYRHYDEQKEILQGLNLVSATSYGIIDFFKDHKNTEILRVDSYYDYIKYRVTDTLDYYDEDVFCELYETPDSYLYDEIPYEGDTAFILNAIFHEKLGTFRVGAEYSLYNMREIELLRELNATDCAPNPHVYFYGCAGENQSYYNEFKERGDWELCMEQSIAQTKNICFDDSAVVPKFAEWVDSHPNQKCIYYGENRDELLTPAEFYKKVKGN